MPRFVDLHLHTNCSDGTLAPVELLELVRSAELAAFSVTDHDTLDGYRQIKGMLTDHDPELVAGIELSVSNNVYDLHLLAYCFDPENEKLNQALEQFQTKRNQRGHTMVERLNKLGVNITFEDVARVASGAAIGRPHIARAILDSKAVKSFEEAFTSYIGNNGPAYVPKENFTIEETIKLVHAAGGAVVLAHPAIEETYRYLPMLVESGLDGIELAHPSANVSDRDRIKNLARQYNLLMTGGSDFHGLESRHALVGSQKVELGTLTALKERSRNIRKSN